MCIYIYTFISVYVCVCMYVGIYTTKIQYVWAPGHDIHALWSQTPVGRGCVDAMGLAWYPRLQMDHPTSRPIYQSP